MSFFLTPSISNRRTASCWKDCSPKETPLSVSCDARLSVSIAIAALTVLGILEANPAHSQAEFKPPEVKSRPEKFPDVHPPHTEDVPGLAGVKPTRESRCLEEKLKKMNSDEILKGVPESFVQQIYAEEAACGAGRVNVRYTRQLQKLWEMCHQREEETGKACVNFDMFVQANRVELSDVKIVVLESDANRATVRSTFKNFGIRKTVIYELVRESDAWAIDEIISGCHVLSNILRGESTCPN